MNSDLRQLLMLLFGVASFIDAGTTYLGVASVLKPKPEDPVTYVVCVGPAIAVLALLLMSRSIWTKSTTFFLLARFVWFIAVAYDLWTSFSANIKVIVFGTRRLLEGVDVIVVARNITSEQLTIVTLSTFLVSASPILFSFLLEET